MRPIFAIATGFVITAVAAIMVNFTAIAQSNPDLFNYPQTKLSGLVSAEINVSENSCRQICTSRSGCAGYDHSTSSSVCRIFANVGGASGNTQYVAGTRMLIAGYGPPSNPAAPPPPPPPPSVVEPPAVQPPPVQEEQLVFNRYRSQDLTRRASRTYGAQSIDQCEGMCQTAKSWCRAYTFDDWNQKCYLKEGAGDLLLNARVISGVSRDLGAPSASGAPIYFEYFNNKAFPGNGDREINVRNRNDCESACRTSGQCMAFSFTQSRSRCLLFNRPREYSNSSGTSSGAKRQE